MAVVAAGGEKGFAAPAGATPVEQCRAMLTGLSIGKAAPVPHAPCVKTEREGAVVSSNEVHHEALAAAIGYAAGTYPPVGGGGHVPVSLFLKGKKKKELILVVKKAASAFDMAKFGKSLGISGGLRFADAKQMEASLGVAQDFVSPLTLVKDAGCVVDVVIDAALQEGDAPLFLLPPGVNTESWPLTCTELLAFCSAGGRSAKAVDFGAL